jgi:hypothetical protein
MPVLEGCEGNVLTYDGRSGKAEKENNNLNFQKVNR